MILAAAAALVACSKNELVPVEAIDAETEIAYLTAPVVKAEDPITFSRDWKFKSTSFYLQKAKAWKDDATTSTKYIDNAEIEWDTDLWRCKSKKYYWPKDGKLTFFAWTNVTESISYKDDTDYGKGTSTFGSYISGVTVTNTDGVKIADYDVTAKANKNVDVLVADIKADQVANNEGSSKAKYNTNGVPTLFKHKLSKVIFTAQTVDENGTAYDYSNPDGITFTINSIKFEGIDSKNTYTQGVTVATDGTSIGEWSATASASAEQIYFNKENETAETRFSAGFPVTKTQTGIYASANQYYYLPQNFEAQTSGSANKDYFVVNYTIKYANGTEETIEQNCIMNNTVTASSVFDKWEMAKIYTINLKFSLNEILWDPAVEDWTTGSANVDIQ